MKIDSFTHGDILIRHFELPNSGAMMSGQATNCYMIGRDEVTLVDAGSRDAAGLLRKAISTIAPGKLERIVLTHTHPDHAGAIRELRNELTCPVLVHPLDEPIFGKTISWNEIDGTLSEDQPVSVEGVSFWPLLTPGHAPGHVALYQPDQRVLLAGDLVSGNGTIGIFPPHGDMLVYINSLRRARELDIDIMYPGHGPAIDNATDTFDFYIERRLSREQQIIDCLNAGPRPIEAMLDPLYPDILDQFRYAAESTILAHLLKLQADGRAACESSDPRQGMWELVPDEVHAGD